MRVTYFIPFSQFGFRRRVKVEWPYPFMQREKRFMSPKEIQDTMDLILSSQADAVIRMERIDEQIAQLFVAVRENTADIRKLIKENRAHEKRMRAVEKSKNRADNKLEGLRDIMRILARLTATH